MKLYKAYPDWQINVEQEQALIEAHENLILQFPLYWFNCPPLLKKWLDDVLTYNWAYGLRGNKLKDKKIALAVSLGGNEDDYKGALTFADVLRSFEMTINYVNALKLNSLRR